MTREQLQRIVAQAEQALGMGAGAWDMVDPTEIVAEVVTAWAKDHADVLAHADGELSAIAHGRPPSDKEQLLRMSGELRAMYKKAL